MLHQSCTGNDFDALSCLLYFFATALLQLFMKHYLVAFQKILESFEAGPATPSVFSGSRVEYSGYKPLNIRVSL